MWIFERKIKADGTIDNYRPKFVIKGYKKHEGLAYIEIYSHMMRILFIKMILDITTLQNLEVHQMDVKIV